ncbi:MAG: rhodanese-like domain-containing protein [Proteobacteria bacterium]|nr:rhodanese-like domain-containing protein [Pseudomonadota bacterium]
MTFKCSILFAISIIFIFTFVAVSVKADNPRYADPEETMSLIKNSKALTVDTMSYIECMDHRIPGSICISLEEFDRNAPLLLKNKKRPIVFYCESKNCVRAGEVYKKAVTMGYEDIYILKGGLPEWKSAGYEVETMNRVRRTPVVSIKFNQLQKMMTEKKGILILDVRTESLFKEGHIEGALNIPMYMLHKQFHAIPGNRPIIVVDENGKRSFIASSFLISKGFGNVQRLFSGMAYKEKQDKIR